MLSLQLDCQDEQRLGDDLEQPYFLFVSTSMRKKYQSSPMGLMHSRDLSDVSPVCRCYLIPRIKQQRQKKYCHLWIDNHLITQ